MERLHTKFNSLRYLVYNLQQEINLCKTYYRDYMLFMHNFSQEHKFRLLYALATTKEKIPVYVRDAQKGPDGGVHSDTLDGMMLTRRFVLGLLQFGPRLHRYIIDLWQQTNSLVDGLKSFSDIFTRLTRQSSSQHTTRY